MSTSEPMDKAEPRRGQIRDVDAFLRSQRQRLATLHEHLDAVGRGLDALHGMIETRATEVDREPGIEAAERTRDAIAGMRESLNLYRGEVWEAPLSHEQVSSLFLICTGIRGASLALSKWVWDLLQAIGEPGARMTHLRPLEHAVAATSVDMHWLRSLSSHFIGDTGQSRMQRLRARRKASLRAATYYYHEAELRTLETIGLLEKGTEHDPADIEAAMQAFLALSLEVANNAIASRHGLPGEDDDRLLGEKVLLRSWAEGMRDILTIGPS